VLLYRVQIGMAAGEKLGGDGEPTRPSRVQISHPPASRPISDLNFPAPETRVGNGYPSGDPSGEEPLSPVQQHRRRARAPRPSFACAGSSCRAQAATAATPSRQQGRRGQDGRAALEGGDRLRSEEAGRRVAAAASVRPREPAGGATSERLGGARVPGAAEWDLE
jgi:hypothetical protein